MKFYYFPTANFTQYSNVSPDFTRTRKVVTTTEWSIT